MSHPALLTLHSGEIYLAEHNDDAFFVREGTLLPLQASDSRVTDAPFIVREVRIYQGGTAHTAGPADGFWYDTDESGKILRRRAEG